MLKFRFLVAIVSTGLVGTGMFAPQAARADPCEAPLPTREGQAFEGQVRYVGDGDGLCVGRSSDPASWIEVRLADFDAPELDRPGGRDAKQRLKRLAIGRSVRCRAVRGRSGRVIVYDRVMARCALNGRSLGDLLRAAGAREGGR